MFRSSVIFLCLGETALGNAKSSKFQSSKGTPIDFSTIVVRRNSSSEAASVAAFYSATAKFVTLLASLPQGGNWVRGGQDLAANDT